MGDGGLGIAVAITVRTKTDAQTADGELFFWEVPCDISNQRQQ